MKDRKRKHKLVLYISAIGLCLLTFTPIIIPKGVYTPELFGIPYSLWTSFLITITLVYLAYLGTKVLSGEEEEEVQP